MDLMQELLRFEKEGKLNAVQQLWFRKTKPVEELYDTKSDPFELQNLAGDSAYSGKLKELRAQLDQWMKYCGDKGFIPEKELLESMWPGMKQPVTAMPSFLENGTVSIRCSTDGSSISWQILDSGQTVKEHNWQLYQHPLVVPLGKRVLAISERIGYKASDIEEFVPVNDGSASR